MKTILATVVVCLFLPLLSSAQSQQEEWKRNFENSKNIAVKLFPDAARADSQLRILASQMENALKRENSPLYASSIEPLVICVAASVKLNLTPNLEALTPEERQTFEYSLCYALGSAQDFSQEPAPVAQTVPRPQSKPFNPGSMNDDALANKPAAPQVAAAPTDPNLKPTRNGYLYFYNDLVNKSGGLKGQKDGPIIYRSGPFGGMTEGQAKASAQEQWAALSHDQQMACEQNAATYGPGVDPDAPNEKHIYNYQPNGMGGGTITEHQ